MDEFLTDLYHEEQEKVAAADLGNFMDSVPTSELEEFLGLQKTAVAGPAEPPLPTKGGNPEKDQKKVEKEVAEKEAMVRRIEKIARIDWGQAGRATLSNTALGAGLGAGIGALRADEGKRGAGALRGAAIGGAAGLGASAGSALGGGLAYKFGKKNAIDRVQRISDASLAGFAPGAITGGVLAHTLTMTPKEKAKLQKKYGKKKQASLNKEAILGNVLIGGLTGRMVAGGDEETPKSGFWRGAAGGVAGGTLGGLAGVPLGVGGMATGALAGTIGGGYLGGKSARLSPEEKAIYQKQRAATLLAKANMAKQGMVMAVPYEPAPLDSEMGAKRGRTAGGIVGGGLGGLYGAAAGAGAAGGKGAIIGGLAGAGLGAWGGRALGAWSGRKASDNRREQMMGDMRQKADMIRQLRAEGAFKKQGSVASEKAEIAMRAMNVTRDAPPHIKQAAAQFAGKEMAKVGGKVGGKVGSTLSRVAKGAWGKAGGSVGGNVWKKAPASKANWNKSSDALRKAREALRNQRLPVKAEPSAFLR